MQKYSPGNTVAIPDIQLKSLFEGAAQVTLSQSIATFLKTDMAGKSQNTVSWYRRKLEALSEYLGENRLLLDIMDYDLLDWYAYLDHRQQLYGFEKDSTHPVVEAGLSTYTKHGHVRAVKRFFRWLYQRKVLQADLGEVLKLPKLPKNGRKGISEVNLKAILHSAQGNVRDTALLRFIESTGVRRGGTANLVFTDLDLGNHDPRLRRRATVREKGEKERIVCMSSGALEALEAWLEERPDIHDDHVFLGHSPGQPWHALSDGGISAVVARYKDRLGLKGDCSPHEWRHRWARYHLQHGMELSQVSQLLGHEDVSITVRFYGQFTIDQLQDAFDKHSSEPDLD